MYTSTRGSTYQESGGSSGAGFPPHNPPFSFGSNGGGNPPQGPPSDGIGFPPPSPPGGPPQGPPSEGDFGSR